MTSTFPTIIRALCELGPLTLMNGGQDGVMALRLLVVQAALTFFLGIGAYGYNPELATAVWVGGGVATAANGWMTLVMFRRRAARSPESLLLSLYVGEIGKFLFVMAFFAIAFKKLSLLAEPGNALGMFIAFLLVQAVIWLWPVVGALAKTPKG